MYASSLLDWCRAPSCRGLELCCGHCQYCAGSLLDSIFKCVQNRSYDLQCSLKVILPSFGLDLSGYFVYLNHLLDHYHPEWRATYGRLRKPCQCHLDMWRSGTLLRDLFSSRNFEYWFNLQEDATILCLLKETIYLYRDHICSCLGLHILCTDLVRHGLWFWDCFLCCLRSGSSQSQCCSDFPTDYPKDVHECFPLRWDVLGWRRPHCSILPYLHRHL